MRIIESTNARAVERLVARQHGLDPTIVRRVDAIVRTVRAQGDQALARYARKFDRLDDAFELTREEVRALAAGTPETVRPALRAAAGYIARVARRQLPKGWRTRVAPGVTIEQRATPLARVGCYVPAGRFPLPSSLLMAAIPARVAGVSEIIAICPRPAPVVAAAALEAGVTRFFRLGGAHGIAALAYGTESVPRVDKIVGPGSAYVAAAKRRVSGDCAIDFLAGPTELVALVQRGDADWIAADLVAQAEHDSDARVLLVTPNRRLARAVAARVAVQLSAQPAARGAVSRHGAIVITRTAAEAIALVNRLAPEHVFCDEEIARRANLCAGTIFVGRYSAPAAGDYATGSNHVLPTNGAARFRGGLSAADFVRVITVQRITRTGLNRLAPTVTALARAEGLVAHAASVEVRRLGTRGPRSRAQRPTRRKT